ncbi:mycofactocin-coupled SDR family oxidoreductase [Mycobacterium sp. 236(2023)]|uniref:mycofactocin-coupled SDR family oxidoreductase n=1 Tax=Mycobacterium sp. 236(2023) TaxID=3038163 RepID=UPI002414EB71|nr:mycofactocin-coupled SDR family oxidoreductase [Mycobacterium sp. 236(2023)]MDG4668087.1 mycofactocin-coupled SDR family oxidoreductase [Mycobacterium sp. 236(2023)]
MGQLDGMVAFITGAARGQGRSHAEALAAEGADIVGIDICEQIDTVSYPMATSEDLEETVALVEKHGRRMIAHRGDVRDLAAMRRVVDEAVGELGRLDIVAANAGIMAHSLPPYANSEQAWKDSIDTMLTGVWNTLQATVPHLIAGGRGGSIAITSSAAGLRARTTERSGGADGYFAAKFGVVGLMKAYAGALAEYQIRVNSLHPTGVDTPMVVNDFFPTWIKAHPVTAASSVNALPVPMVDPSDVSNALLYLVGDSGRYVTGTTMTVDAGLTTIH